MIKRELYRGATVSVGVMSRVLVIVHGDVPPSREDWPHVCDAIRDNHKVARGQLVMTAGPAPNAAQRKAALDVLPKNFVAPPCAVLTETILVRGVLTALNWFLNDSHRAFRPNDVAGVAKHLKITEKEAADLIAFALDLVPLGRISR